MIREINVSLGIQYALHLHKQNGDVLRRQFPHQPPKEIFLRMTTKPLSRTAGTILDSQMGF